ncbi:HNH/ENDO VII family nuclease [Lachnospiraceae bacterium 48-42]|nr:hypothetical protein [Dorea sp.]
MKRLITLLLSCALVLVGCGQAEVVNSSVNATEQSAVEKSDENEIPEDEVGDDTDYTYEVAFENLNDENLLKYVEDAVYSDMVTGLNSDEYFIENVNAAYISQEYLDEVAYNSQANIYFGYTLDELENLYTDSKYVFALGEDGQTVVHAFEDYDDTYDKVLRNVAIGTGVILVCVTVSVVSGGAGAPAISMIFAASAKTGTGMALSSGIISGAATGIVTGIQTGDVDEAVKSAALAGSESFKWGAIAGAVAGGAKEVIALKGATLNGLTMNEAASIQKESGYPIEVIKQLHRTEEYQVLKEVGLKPAMINGKTALIRGDIDLDLLDEFGRSNLKRMSLGLAPLDANGISFELHHIGQEADATLAILTQTEHDNAALHGFKAISEIERDAFAIQRKKFWKTMEKVLSGGGS